MQVHVCFCFGFPSRRKRSYRICRVKKVYTTLLHVLLRYLSDVCGTQGRGAAMPLFIARIFYLFLLALVVFPMLDGTVDLTR